MTVTICIEVFLMITCIESFVRDQLTVTNNKKTFFLGFIEILERTIRNFGKKCLFGLTTVLKLPFSMANHYNDDYTSNRSELIDHFLVLQ